VSHEPEASVPEDNHESNLKAKATAKGSDLGLLADVVDPGKNLDNERDRQKSLEQRGITIITSTGTFVTLIFAVAALITKLHGAKSLDTAEIVLIVVSMVAFLAAGLFGIWVNKPEDYGALDRNLLEKALGELSKEDIGKLRRQTSLAVSHARDVNAAKAQRLILAIVCQVIAIAILVSAIVLIVVGGRAG
jgi:hypothetical protein